MSVVTAADAVSAINNYQRSMALPTIVATLDTNTDRCVEWPHGRDRDGYGVCYLAPAGDRHQLKTSAHRVVALLTYGDPPEPAMHAAHGCHNRACINPKHLHWATAQQNIRERDERRRNLKESHHV